MSMNIHIKELSSRQRLTVLSLTNLNNGTIHSHIGNKALRLIKLSGYGYRIPSSLFLDYSWFDYFLEHDRIAPRLIDHIIKQKLGENIAIRSSSNVEDSAGASHAGIFKSEPAVPNKHKRIEHAIAECYKSLLKFQRGQSAKNQETGQRQMRMGVIVQPTIDAKVSGILFTTAPEDPSRGYLQIQFGRGTGERVTSSQETGFSVILHKKTGKVIRQEGDLELLEQYLPKLRKTAESLESRLHFPQDVEFAISQTSGKIFLLQTRSITAFSCTPEHVIAEEIRKLRKIFRQSEKIYGQHPILSSSNISEFFSYSTPLGFSIFKTVFAGTANKQGAINTGREYLGYAPITKKEQTQLFLSVGDQARMNLLIDAFTFRVAGLDRNVYLKKAVKRYMALMGQDPEKANYPEGQVYLQAPQKREWNEYYGRNGLLYYERYVSFLENLRKEKIPSVLDSIPQILSENTEFYEKALRELSSNLSTMKPVNLPMKLSHYLIYLREDLCVHYVKVARIAFLSTFLVKNELTKISPKFIPSVHRNNIESRRSSFVENYFNLLLANEDCPDNLKSPSPSAYFRRVRRGKLTFKEFLRLFGHIGSLDIKEPRLCETPKKMLWNLLRLQTPKMSKVRKTESTKALKFYKKYQRLYPAKAKELREWVQLAKKFMTLRETLKLEILKPLYLIKRVILEMQSRLELNNGLIYYLNCGELESMNPAKPNGWRWRFKALIRKAKHEACASVEVQNVIKTMDDTNLSTKSQAIEGRGNFFKELDGKTILHGEARGACLFASDSQEYYKKLVKFRKKGIKNIIGVFKGIEPSYCYLSELKGMVTEHGGYLAHAATIAREYNIPYISNVAIDHLQNAHYIVLDTQNHKVVFRE